MLSTLTVLLGLWGFPTAAAQDKAPTEQTIQDYQMQIRQLQAQLDVVMEDMTELEKYRKCAEQKLIYSPESAKKSGTMCVSPSSPEGVRALPGQQAAIAGGKLKQLRAGAKTYVLPPPTSAQLPAHGDGEDDDAALPSLPATPLQEAAVQPLTQQPVAPVAPTAADAPAAAAQDGASSQQKLTRSQQLLQAALAKALGETDKTPQEIVTDIEQTKPIAALAPVADNTPAAEPAKPQGMAAPLPAGSMPLVPSCQEGEFLTVIQGVLQCQRASNAGKLACPPATLRVWLGWQNKHTHFSVPFTRDGDEQEVERYNAKIKVICANAKYKLESATRRECGGNVCKPGKAASYSLTFECGRGPKGRCYARQHGQLSSSLFTDAYIVKQYDQ